MNIEAVERVGEQPDDVHGSIREVVADAAYAPVVGDHAAAVAVDQPADELLGFVINDGLLPRFECNTPAVFLTGAVLREQARPVLRVQRHFDAVHGSLHDLCVRAIAQSFMPAAISRRTSLNSSNDLT